MQCRSLILESAREDDTQWQWVGGSSSIVWEDFDPVGVRCVLEGLVHCGYREVNVPTHCFEATRMFLDYIGETRKQLN